MNQEVEMGSLTRHLVEVTVASLSIVFVGTVLLSFRQLPSITDPEICTTPASGDASEASFLVENGAAMRKMMRDMVIKPTGDVDADFVAMMVPHHQGAVDMALAVLRHGRNPQIRRLAQEIIVTQQQEISAMRLAVSRPLPPSKASPWEVQQIETKSSQRSERAMEP
jgi:hypothetical protein